MKLKSLGTMQRFLKPHGLQFTKSVSTLLIVLITTPCVPTGAEELTYQVPTKTIADLVDVAPTPGIRLSPDRKTALLLEQPSLPGIAVIAQPELKLAGLRINPKNSGPSRIWSYKRMYLQDLTNKESKPIPVAGIPDGARITDVEWSPDGTKIGFAVTNDTTITLWTVDVSAGRASKLIDAPLNACYLYDSPFSWVSDGTIIAKLVPKDRGPEPAQDIVPHGPIVQENDGQKRPSRTQPDLLKSPYDEQLFDYYMRAQLARIYPDSKVEPIGLPALYLGIEPSPDAHHLLTEVTHHPYSYKVAIERFPYRVDINTLDGKLEKQIADNPLAEEVPIDFSAVPTGPRDFGWRSDADATVHWVEARDGGDPKKEAAVRDEVLMWRAPFEGKPSRLAELPLRYSGVTWGDGQLALIRESWWTNRKTRTYMVAPDAVDVSTAKPRLIWDRSYEDRYSDPGRPALDLTPRGTNVIHRTDKGNMLLIGDGACPEGDRPFLDDFDIKSLNSKRLWQSQAPVFEYVVAVLNKDGSRLLTRRETVSEQPQYYLRLLPDNTLQRLTHFPNPNPTLANTQSKLIQYERADGVKLSGILYLPPDFKAGESKPLPLLMWAYPSEFKTKEAAGQVKDSPYRFVRAQVLGPLFALLMGFAVLDNPQFPIVGEGKAEPNDTYVPQLIAGAQAAVNEVVRLGVADRDRLAIGGHSYGAFTTANLLAHTDLFRAGIARSGAYNRTLTPFGFQSEERTFWQARQVYMDMSPFTYADKIDEPLLLIHGEVDDNQGTFPIQSERLFEAMKGLGGKVRYVVLPAEMHGYRARESVLHMFWEMQQWLDKNVKNAAPRK